MKAGLSQTAIAKIIGVHKSTMSRGVRRNRGLRGYRPKQAHYFTQASRAKAVRPRISSKTWSRVEHLLRSDWSPEQISGAGLPESIKYGSVMNRFTSLSLKTNALVAISICICVVKGNVVNGMVLTPTPGVN